jgi:hypothetical protein
MPQHVRDFSASHNLVKDCGEGDGSEGADRVLGGRHTRVVSGFSQEPAKSSHSSFHRCNASTVVN